MSATEDEAPAEPHDLSTDAREHGAAAPADTVVDAGAPADATDERLSARIDQSTPRWIVGLQVVTAAILGSLPILWVLGALPWRSPTLLIENMFRGFATCALADGALNPIVMVCRRAGAPIGMYQLDGGLSYPLGGVFMRLGADPLAAWKLSVAVLIVPGIGALFWLLRRMTGSPVLAAAFVALNGLNGSLTARTWNWYWNIVAVLLLPLLFAVLYVLFDRGRRRRLRPLLLPGAAALVTVTAIGIEWQYTGLFATAVAVGAVALLAVLPGWRILRRVALVAAGAAGVAIVAAVLRVRLSLAGIAGQYDDTLTTASDNAIDLVALIAPDPRTSLLGWLLVRLGHDDLVVRGLAGGRQLWVAPYLGVATVVFLLVVGVVMWRRRRPNPRLPAAYTVLLLTVLVASVVLSTGPQPQLASVSDPTTVYTSPFAGLYLTDPLRWIRYPWTWGYLTHVAGLLSCAAVASLLLRRRRGWSPLVGVLVAILAIEFISPQVLNAFRSTRPSVSMATAWTRVTSDDPTVTEFEAQAIPELERALRSIEGPALLLPWGNTYIAPHLGPEAGAEVRNVGIDRNLHQIEAVAPFERRALRRPTPETLQQILDSGWATGVVLLDHVPSGESILRFDHAHLRRREDAWTRRIGRLERRMANAGYCVTPHSWFTVFTRCTDHHDLPARAGRASSLSATAAGPSSDDGDTRAPRRDGNRASKRDDRSRRRGTTRQRRDDDRSASDDSQARRQRRASNSR